MTDREESGGGCLLAGGRGALPAGVRGGRLYGAGEPGGVCLCWHEGFLERDWEWSPLLGRGSLSVCLNFAGRVTLGPDGDGDVATVGADEAFVLVGGASRIRSRREGGGMQRFAVLLLTPEYLRIELGEVLGDGLPGLDGFARGRTGREARLAWHGPIPGRHRGLRRQLPEPPVTPAVRPLWYRAKILEIASHLLVRPPTAPEMFCLSRKRLMAERCEQVHALLVRDLENPPTLAMLAEETRCSPSHLSRAFTAHFGESIPATVRRLRIERARELLAQGASVTEAAFSVGYSSLGAFHKAFLELTGQTPGDFQRSRP